MTSAPWSPSDTIALVALAIAVLVPLVTIWLTGRQQSAAREDERREQRRREVSLVLAPLMGFLDDGDPDRLGINADPTETPRRLQELRTRFESEIRPGLMAVAVGSPSAVERDLAKRLAVAVHNSLTSAGWFAMSLVGDARGSGDVVDMRQTAKTDHEEASKLADELAAAIRSGD